MTAEQPQKKPKPQRAALKLRERARNKKPAFVRAESWKYDRFSLSWRRPRGLDNKIRRKIKGWPPGASTGYKGPKSARYLHPSGYKEVIVFNTGDLAALNPETQAARIAHTVGKRKRATIIAEAKTLNIKILNIKVVAAEKKEGEEEKAEGEEKEKTSEDIEKEATEEVEEQTTEKEEQPEAEEKDEAAAEEEKPAKEKKSRKSRSKTDTEKDDEEAEGEEEQ